MKRYTIFMLMVLLASSTLLAVMPAGAQGIVVPGDLDGDRTVSVDEMDAAEQSYQDGKITSEELEEIRHIHENYPRTTTDYRGTEVTIYKPTKTIIPLAALQSVEIVRALGVRDKIIGVCKYVPQQPKYFPEVSKVTNVGGVPPDNEKILELSPDLLIATGGTCARQADIEKVFEGTDVTIARFKFGSIVPSDDKQTMEEQIKSLGYILEKDDEAELFVDFIQDNIDKIKEKTSDIPEDEKPKVYIGVSSSLYKTCGKDSSTTPICALAGGKNIAADLSGCWPVVDPEWVVEQNPDIILRIPSVSVVPSGYETDDPSEMAAAREDILNRPELANVNAVKNGQVYILSYRIGSSGPSTIVGVVYMAKWFHPELFKDLDPQAIHQQYIDMQGLDYDLNEQGVFVYPPLEDS